MRRVVLPLLIFLSCCFHGLCQSAPQITTQPQSQIVQAGQPATFSLTAVGESTCNWYLNNVELGGGPTCSFTFTPSIANTGAMIYSIVRASNGQQVQSQLVTISVIPRTDIPTVNIVEEFGTVQAPQIANGFGLNVTSYEDWQFAACASIHCSWVRFDCPWSSVEIQAMPSNTSGGFTLSPNCAAALKSTAAYDLHPSITAYWGPPYSTIATGVTAADTPIGSTSITIGSLSSGSLDNAVGGQTTVSTNLANINPTAVAMYEGGSLVESISGNTLNLTMATNVDIPAGTKIKVSLLLYPPIMIPPQSNNTSYISNPSLQAFDNYLHFLALSIAAAGATGAVEMWNEPENSNECWDWAPNCYDSPPPSFSIKHGSGIAIAFSAMSIPPVAGVKYANGWTDGTGSQTLYYFGFAPYFTASVSQANQAYAWESLHPYGIMPEQTNWIPACLKKDSYPGGPNVSFACTPIGGQIESNFKNAASLNLYPQNLGGLHQGITESGMCRTCFSTAPQETDIARFDLRQFIAFEGNGVSPIIFFKAGDDPSFNWFMPDHTPYPVATAFQGFMEDLSSIGNAPVTAYTDATLPQVTSYTGFYPLAHVSVVGSRPGASSNSVISLVWQKTYTVPPPGSSGSYADAAPWFTLPSPAATPVSLTIPYGMAVTSVRDLVQGAAVSYNLTSQVLTYPVADNPIEVILDPAPGFSSQTITFANPAEVAFGTPPVTLQASSTSGLPVTYSIAGPAAASGSILTITGAGVITITAMQAGSPAYAAAVPVTQTLNVTPAQPSISWMTPAPIPYGTPLTHAQLSAWSSTPGTFVYTPAAGVKLPAGKHILSVNFIPANGTNYLPATRQVTLVVSGLVNRLPVSTGRPIRSDPRNPRLIAAELPDRNSSR